jgi:hypothetical protein
MHSLHRNVAYLSLPNNLNDNHTILLRNENEILSFVRLGMFIVLCI